MFESGPAKGLGLICIGNSVADVIDGLADIGVSLESFVNDHVGDDSHLVGGDIEHLRLYRVAN